MTTTARQTFFHILHKPLPNSRAARFANYFLAALILANALMVALETVPAIHQPYREMFFWLETASLAMFTVEYGLRLWTCVEQKRLATPLVGRLRYALQPLPLIDLIVILTFFFPTDLRFLRLFRLTRLLRVVHLDELDHSVQSVVHAIGRRKNLLIVSMIMMLIAVYCTAAVLYLVEHTAQPEKFSSIPETLWWSVVTLTTIGYGDVTPITPLGKLLAGASAIIGIGIFALPTAIVTAAILEAGADSGSDCPHCGRRTSKESVRH